MGLKRFLIASVIIALVLSSDKTNLRADTPTAKYVILMIADGWGIKHIEATNDYIAATPAFQSWTKHWVTTYSAGGGYDPGQAWTNFSYVVSNTTDSAAAATAMFAGVKTDNLKVTVSTANSRLFSVGDKARSLGKSLGAVSSVQISHATPGAWHAHNDNRVNGYAIADEGLFGNPNTSGTPANDARYSGGHGSTLPPADVMLGGGHPDWNTTYMNTQIRDKLASESGQPGAYSFVERMTGSPDGGPRLLSAANLITVTRLAGLFGGYGGNLDYRLADGSGFNPENPTLGDMTSAALTVLNRSPNGFALMIEGGAIDWAGHNNEMGRMIGEMIDFNQAVQVVADWVDNPTNGSSWANTLVIVTGDHETGYLTAKPGVLPDQPLGSVNAGTLASEKPISGTGRRASWDDANGNDQIDPAETVYWAWNSGGHSNSLIPLYVKGVGANLFATFATGSDPVRGAYIDNTDVFRVMDAVVKANQAPTASFTATPGNGPLPLAVDFNATDSTDPDGTIISHEWNFGDGNSGFGAVISHTYTQSGTYTAVLTVTDSYSATGSSLTLIEVNFNYGYVFLPVILH